MSPILQLGDDERSFLLHWGYESTVPFWGPAYIWCLNNRVHPHYGPYPLAELFWQAEREAGRPFWSGFRPRKPFKVPWTDAGHFWVRVEAALSRVLRLSDDPRFAPSAFCWDVEGRLTSDEVEFLRAYNQEMVRSGTGPHVDQARRRGVLGHHLAPFFVLLDDLGSPSRLPASYPWTDFSSRYAELTKGRHDDAGLSRALI